MLMKAGTEAMRALCYVTAASMDFMYRAEDDALRERHAARFALLTPVVKAWSTELAQELTSLGVQVHGGMGFIEETGAAQFLRDARIITIYEGTTGIQANDLVGRKVIRDEGRAMQALVAEIRAAIAKAQATGDALLAEMAGRQAEAVQALEDATRWLLGNTADPAAAGSAAVNYLMLTGTVCGGWQMLRAATKARRLLPSGGDRDFLAAKLATARFYAAHLLPRARAHAQAVMAGPETVMALPPGQL